MSTNRLKRLITRRAETISARKRQLELEQRADDVVHALKRGTLHAERDGNQVTFTITEKFRASWHITAGLILAGLGAGVWWDGHIPLTTAQAPVWGLVSIILIGLTVATVGLLARQCTWSLTVAIDDPLMQDIETRIYTINYLRKLRPEPGHSDRLMQETLKRNRTVINDPRTELRRAPSKLSEIIAQPPSRRR